MRLNRVEMNFFKNIVEVNMNLGNINVLIGGNNSGKSSILQGIHFKIIAATIARQSGLSTFSSELLLFNPASDFTKLRNSSDYTNSSGFRSRMCIYGTLESNIEQNYTIEIYKGRNYGNIGVERGGDFYTLGQTITESEKLFSIYVPGLAGVSSKEELRSKAIVRRGVASGEANLYLRNIIYYINESNKLDELNSLINEIFSNVRIEVKFSELHDVSICVNAKLYGNEIPLELLGTGILQAIQIFSYVVYFRPKLLLLDEPDSHLHPDNQRILASILQEVTSEYDLQIIMSTHSRHIVDALYGKANFIWLDSGTIKEQGFEIEKLSILMDIGALDSIDRLRNDNLRYIVLTEDRNKDYLTILLESNGFKNKEFLIHSYNSCSNLDLIEIFVNFIREIAPNCRVIVHRDRDFMTKSEVDTISSKLRSKGVVPFFTEGSDIESYFVRNSHVAKALGTDNETVQEWINELARANHNKILGDFYHKRDEIKKRLYKNNEKSYPKNDTLIGNNIPLPIEFIKGKYMLKKINGDMHNKFSRNISLKKESEHLRCEILQAIISETSKV